MKLIKNFKIFSMNSICYLKVVAYPAHNEIIKVVQVRLMVAWRSCGRTIYTGLSLLNNHFYPAIITLASSALQYFSPLFLFDKKKPGSSPCLVWTGTYKLSSCFREKWALSNEQSSPSHVFSGLFNTFWFYRLRQTTAWRWPCKDKIELNQCLITFLYEENYYQQQYQDSLAKRAWNSGFTGGMGKRAWNSGFTGRTSDKYDMKGEGKRKISLLFIFPQPLLFSTSV